MQRVLEEIKLQTIYSDVSRGSWWLLLGGITVLALITRFYKVTEPEHVW